MYKTSLESKTCLNEPTHLTCKRQWWVQQSYNIFSLLFFCETFCVDLCLAQLMLNELVW